MPNLCRHKAVRQILSVDLISRIFNNIALNISFMRISCVYFEFLFIQTQCRLRKKTRTQKIFSKKISFFCLEKRNLALVVFCVELNIEESLKMFGLLQTLNCSNFRQRP